MGNRKIITSIMAAAALTLTACGGSSSASTTKSEPLPKLTSEVLYEVEGTTKYASVTWETPTGTSQANPDIPLKRKSSSVPGMNYTFDTGKFVYISAQSKTGSGTVICKISVDGKVISKNSASGYGVATCKGTS